MLATEIMRESFATVRPATPVLNAMHLLQETNQRLLPVISGDGVPVGIITEDDCLRLWKAGAEFSEPLGGDRCPEIGGDRVAASKIGALPVEAVMTCDPLCVDQTTAIDRVIQKLEQGGAAGVLVLRSGQVAGVISRVQLLQRLVHDLGHRSES